MRIGTARRRAPVVDYKLESRAAALGAVDRSIEVLEDIVHHAGAAGCDVIALNEDTLGLIRWEAAHWEAAGEVLPAAVERMLARLGEAAAAHEMYLVCANDTAEPDGTVCNTAFFLGRDGREIGRYRKVNLPMHEQLKARGHDFPVFETPDLGGVGMLICYDMVFPEAARCLALGGADVIFHPTLGGAAMGDGEVSLAAFRTRAVENFVYIVVAWGGSGSLIVSPKGEILADGHGPGDVVTADIDPFGGRESMDSVNSQVDMRARLFRERAPAAYGRLTDPSPPVLAKICATDSPEEVARIGMGIATVGEDRFKEAEELMRRGKRQDAVRTFEALRKDYPKSWIDRASRDRIEVCRNSL